ncbi:hypothetical protein HPB48_004550 [Haemaphysalis longicornis]|uniref:Uncharacterized protein n=1 Tax=Haemaphysalis longicornis TaxID=44386 RepID=A0A9J6GHC2_HAELO|nr:hypothetical protein HPB48_004550 [Haemaphysalis longicornis]
MKSRIGILQCIHCALRINFLIPFDSLSGLTFGGDQGGLRKRGYGHGEFDEIDHAGWPGFYKRNFDEIDRTGFEGFYKRSAAAARAED